VYADDVAAAQKLMDSQVNVASTFHTFLDNQRLVPGSPLAKEFSDWSDLLSDSSVDLISRDGTLNISSLESLRTSCASYGINAEGFSFDVCGHVIGYLERRAPLLDFCGASHGPEALAHFIITKVIQHEEEPVCV
jgi:hypothetical protein